MQQNEWVVSRETTDKLDIYKKLLLKWNKKINLISKNTEKNIDLRHIDDSLQLRKYINVNDNIIDLGAGGGLPGIVLAIAGYKVKLVESDTRKCSFLREIVRKIKLEAEIIEGRVEEVKSSCDVIVARGFAEINRIFDLTQKIRCERFLLLKGKNSQEEIDNAEKDWIFDYKKYKSISADDSFILDINNVRKKT